jgi:uncharacterized coiled-coil DUF342 family protein
VKKKLIELRKERDELQQKLDDVNKKIIQLKTTCEYEDTIICEFIKTRASYMCKVCKKVIMHR